MLTGQPPFPEGTALQKVLRHSTDDPPDVRQFRPELSPRVAALVSKLLAKKPSQRHQSPAELVADLLQVADQLGISSLRHVRGAALAAAAPSHQWLGKLWQVAAAFALLVAAVIVMIDRIRVHGLNETKVIDAFGRVGQELTDPPSAFAMLIELDRKSVV